MSKTEPLFTCPHCGQANFTRRGLRSHWCDALGKEGKSRAITKDEWSAIVDPPKALAVITPKEHAEMGAQLTEQYHKAVGAMPEILRFGAMMIRLEETLSARGQGSGNGVKGDGVKGWLTEHAPEVSRATAYRFRDVTLAIAEDYAQLVGPKVAKQFALPDLVTADPKKLPESARKKQLALFAYVSGTSQRSWLDKMRPIKARGGNTYERGGAKGKRKSPDEEALIELGDPWNAFEAAWPKHWLRIPHHLLKQWDASMLDKRRLIAKALKGEEA